MRKHSLFLAGALSVIVVALAAGLIFVTAARGFSAREQPSALERWVARRVRGHGRAGRCERSHQSNSEIRPECWPKRAPIGRIIALHATPITAVAIPRWASACIRRRPICGKPRRSK